MTTIQHLIEKGMITQEQCDMVRQTRSSGQTLLDALIEKRYLDEKDVFRFLMDSLKIMSVDVKSVKINFQAFEILPVAFMRKNTVCPLDFDSEGKLVIAMYDPTELQILEALRSILSQDFSPVLALRSGILNKIDEAMSGESDFDTSLKKVERFSVGKIHLDEKMLHSYSAILNADKSPIVEFVNNIIYEAVQERASDIHVEPLEDYVELRYRLDGRLQVKAKIPKNMHRHLVSRLKIISVLDITETRRPQDGRVQLKIRGKRINLRVSTVLTIFGEKVVLRVLDPEEMNISLDQVGLDSGILKTMELLIRQPQGMILVCGPTGSGKTSTLYGALREMRSPEKNILTIEDPVEYTIDGINQIPVNEKIGFTFAKGLRTILRQDPDCILVGEIRDEETAQISFRSSLTGHLVLSTLHTNGSIAAITRLLDMGIEPFVIASSLLGILSQRLVRVTCDECKQSYVPPSYLLDRYQSFFPTNTRIRFYRGTGCPRCRYTGYKGRTGIFEFLQFSPQLRRMICDSVSENGLRDYAVQHLSFHAMVEDGVRKVIQGQTTLEELDCVIGKQQDYCDETLLPAKGMEDEDKLFIRKQVGEFGELSLDLQKERQALEEQDICRVPDVALDG